MYIRIKAVVNYSSICLVCIASVVCRVWGFRALQFSRYLLERGGISDKDKNARPGVVKLIKDSRFRAFLALFKKRELRSPVSGEESHFW